MTRSPLILIECDGLYNPLEIKAIIAHDFRPNFDKIMHKTLCGVIECIDFSDSTQLRT